MSCTTSFDSYGNRQQSIDPAGAAIGAVALGAIAYSIGKNSGKRHEHRRHTSHNRQYDQHWNQGHQHGGRYYR